MATEQNDTKKARTEKRYNEACNSFHTKMTDEMVSISEEQAALQLQLEDGQWADYVARLRKMAARVSLLAIEAEMRLNGIERDEAELGYKNEKSR